MLTLKSFVFAPLVFALVAPSSRPSVLDASGAPFGIVAVRRACGRPGVDIASLTTALNGLSVRLTDGTSCRLTQPPATSLVAFPAKSRASVHVDGGAVEAVIDGKVRWRTDVLKPCPPAVGDPRIRALTVGSDGSIRVTIGKHTEASISESTGAVRCLGAD
jgi:hypothetical protein